jgi:Kef-type K+ transport system membrane component KefB
VCNAPVRRSTGLPAGDGSDPANIGGHRTGLLNRTAADRSLSTSNLAVTLAGLFGCAAVTQLLGLHFVFGAFLFGLVMPASTSGESATN